MAELFLPLRGARIADLSRLLPGPFLTRALADLGADVIKIEDPRGDPARFWPPAGNEHSAAFSALNWGKRSAVIETRLPGGAEILRAVCARCDVVVESFRPGVLDARGIGYEALSALNPRLILCSISGFGAHTSASNAAGHDLNYQARAGALWLSGSPGGMPPMPGIQTADLAGGALHAAVAVLAALLERTKSGRGRHLDISMTRSTSQLLTVDHSRRIAGAKEAPGEGMLSGGVPCYRLYPTADGRSMALAALEPKFFRSFCERAGCTHLSGLGLAQGEEAERVVAELQSLFVRHTQQQWVELLAGCDCCCEPVQAPEEAFWDSGVDLAKVLVDGIEAVRMHFGAQVHEREYLSTPSLGQHTQEVLEELKIDAELTRRARDSGAISP